PPRPPSIPTRRSSDLGEQEPKKFYQIWAPLPIGDRDKKKSDSLKRGQDLPREVGTMAEPHYWSITLPSGRPGRAIGLRYVPHARSEEHTSELQSRENL